VADLKLAEKVNGILEGLEKIEKAWEELRNVAKGQRGQLQNEALDVQKALAMPFVKSRFDIGLPRLLDYARLRGGFDRLRVKQVAKEEKETKNG